MPISSISTNYTGRTRDIFISQGINPRSPATQPITYSFGSLSSCVTGVQKLIQRFAISLINAGLVHNLQSQQSSNIQEVSYIYASTSYDVLVTFKAYQTNTPGIPTDEQLSTAALTNVSVSRGSVNLTVRITTVAGDAVMFILPVPLS